MTDFTFDVPGCLVVKTEASNERDAKELLHIALAHVSTAGVELTPHVRLVSVEIGKDQSPVEHKAGE